MIQHFLLDTGIKRKSFDLFTIENIHTHDMFSINLFARLFVNLEVLIDKENRLFTVIFHDHLFTDSNVCARKGMTHFQLPDHVMVEEHFTQRFSNHYYVCFNLILKPVPYYYYY